MSLDMSFELNGKVPAIMWFRRLALETVGWMSGVGGYFRGPSGDSGQLLGSQYSASCIVDSYEYKNI